MVSGNLSMLTEQVFNSPVSASQAVAAHNASSIEKRLASAPRAAVVVSGGSTPLACYQHLAETTLPWERVYVVPSDERCVPPGHAASNATMIRQSLLQNRAAGASLVSIHDGSAPARDGCESLRQTLESLPLPFATVLLGMGTDGHFASLFPDRAAPSAGLDHNGKEWCLLVETAASPHARISLSLSTLLRSEEILLLFFCEAKRKVFAKARQGDKRYPVSELLRQRRIPVRVFRAPLPDEAQHHHES